MKKTVEVICPLYEAEEYLEKLDESLRAQKKVKILNIKYLLTESKDKTEDILIKLKANYEKIKKADFSHSLVREKAGLESKADIIVFVTQDVEIRDNEWCYHLIKDIDEKIVASYSRQLTKYDNIEKYTRERNYPAESQIVSREDVSRLGLRTFFFSDASSAINQKVYAKLGAYDGKNLPISEDMYFAYKVIMNGYKIKYVAESVVYHSHKFTLKEVYERYKLTGKFMRQNNYLDQYGTNSSGADLAKYILKRAISEKNLAVLGRFLPDMTARYLGMRAGKKSK